MTDTSKSENKPDTAEAKIREILDSKYGYILGPSSTNDDLVQQLKGLLVDARLDELKHVYGPDGDDYMWTDIDEDDVNQKVLDRRAALQQTRQEEVRE